MKKNVMLLLLAALVAGAVSGQTRPRWMQKGVDPVNRERSNESYRFHAFTTSGADAYLLRMQRLEPLADYVSREYGVAADQVRIDSLTLLGDDRTTYRVSFPGQDGTRQVYAQLIDDYSHFENQIGVYGYRLHQLYAISERDATPQFDDFSLTAKYGTAPVFMSLIPGMGQIYKGQSGKGYAILGTEAVLIGGIVYGELNRAHFVRIGKDTNLENNYNSRAASFRTIRNVCIIAGGALYLYNLIDAAAAKGARRVVVQRPDNRSTEIAFLPVVTDRGGMGVGMSVRF